MVASTSKIVYCQLRPFYSSESAYSVGPHIVFLQAELYLMYYSRSEATQADSTPRCRTL